MTIRGPSPLKMLCFEGEAKVHSRRLKRCFTPKRRRNPVHAHINFDIYPSRFRPGFGQKYWHCTDWDVALIRFTERERGPAPPFRAHP